MDMISLALMVIGLVLGFLLCYELFARRAQGPPKVVARMALRKQIHQQFLDIDFNVTEDMSDQEVVDKVASMFDLSGVAFEKINREVEEEIKRKREAVKPEDKIRRIGKA